MADNDDDDDDAVDIVRKPRPGAKNGVAAEAPVFILEHNKTYAGPMTALGKWKIAFIKLGRFKVRVEQPYFEDLAKADKCKHRVKRLGNCLEYQSQITGDTTSVVSIDPSQGVTLERKDGIRKVKFNLKDLATGEAKEVETYDDCNNLQIDMERCVLNVLSNQWIPIEGSIKHEIFSNI